MAISAAIWLVSAGCDNRPAPKPASIRTDEQVCGEQLKQVYQAIQAYRRDHKELPGWLSGLVPQYLADTNILICPTLARNPKPRPYGGLGDPVIPAAYVYDFSNALWVGQPMREFKRRQMGLVGGGIPLVRCHQHEKALSISFDGALFEGPVTWELSYADVLDPAELSVERLFPEQNRNR